MQAKGVGHFFTYEHTAIGTDLSEEKRLKKYLTMHPVMWQSSDPSHWSSYESDSARSPDELKLKMT